MKTIKAYYLRQLTTIDTVEGNYTCTINKLTYAPNRANAIQKWIEYIDPSKDAITWDKDYIYPTIALTDKRLTLTDVMEVEDNEAEVLKYYIERI